MGLSKEHLNTYEFYLSGKDVPTGWEVVSLDDVSFVVTDGTHKTPEYKDKGIRFISIKNIRPYLPINWNSYEKYISHQEHNTLIKRCHPKRDDILFPRVGTLGFAKRIDFDEEVSIFVGLGLIQPVKNYILPKFLEYYMNTPYVNRLSTKRAKGTGRKTLPLEESRRFPVPVAPLVEQRRIVSKIDELFSELNKGVEYLKTAREQLKVYRQAVLKHAFEGKLTEQWREENKHKLEPPEQLLALIKKERNKRHQQQLEEWNIAVKVWELKGKRDKKPNKPKFPTTHSDFKQDEFTRLPELPIGYTYTHLSNLGDLSRGKSKHRPRKDPVLFNGNYPFIQTGEVKASNRIIRKYSKTYNDVGLAQSKLWPKGTLCITIAANIAETAFLGFDACFPDSIVGFTANSELVIPEYVELFFKASRASIEAYAPATAQKNINLATLERLIIPYCSIEEQNIIVNQLEDIFMAIDKTQNEIECSLQITELNRQSILKRAFSGQLVEQDPNEEPASILLERIEAEKTEQEKTHRKNNRKKIGEVTI